MEDPILPIDGFKVSLLNPLFGFVGMSPFGPSPQGLEDCMAYPGKGDFAHDVLVIVGPSSNEQVELHDQITCRRLFVGLDECPYLP